MAHRWQVVAPARAGTAVPGDRGANGRVDDDGDPRGALAAPRRGRLPAGARPLGLLRVAVPVKGRLREPSFQLLEDAGLGPEQPGERALAFPCRNAPVEVLLVRAADVPEYVQDGVVDCGITGHRPRARARRRRPRAAAPRLRLAAGSRRACPRSRPSRSLEELAGATVATVYPRLTRELLPVDVDARRRHGLGRDRAAARPRRRDRRSRLVREHAAHERPALARRPARVGGRARRARRRGSSAVRGDAARRRRGAPPPLRDAERAGDGAPRDLGASSARACRACCRSPSRAWSPCTRSSPRPRSGACCPSSRRPAARRS